VKEFCYEAIEYGAYSVAVNPCHIGLVSDILKGSDVCTGAAIGFPLGATTSATKVFEAEEAIKNGADEIDMILNIGALRDRNFEYVYQDIAGIIKISGELICKVIIETCYLTREEKIAACVVAKSAGADFVKTSTGMGSGGATVEDIILMRRAMGDKLRVKASGDIRSLADVKKMVAAGADRVGVSRLIQIVTDDDYADSASVRNQPPNC
jgi:deoxyribose-phosphate aldolase